MSLGKNSLVAAYQGKGQLKSRPSGTRVVTFIGDSDGGIRVPTRKRLVWIRYPASQRLIQRQCGLQEAADEHFFVQQETCLALWWRRKRDFGERKETLSFVISEVGADSTQEIRVSPDFKWTIGRRLPTVLRSFLTTWFIEDNGQRTNNGIQRRSSQRKGIKL